LSPHEVNNGNDTAHNDAERYEPQVTGHTLVVLGSRTLRARWFTME